MRLIEVESPGLFATVQDLGRPGFGPIGVSASGAADPTALRIVNTLVGNPPGAAGIEMTLQGGGFVFRDGGVIALGGSDFGAEVEGTRVPLWTTREIAPGQSLRCGRTHTGARCYIAVRGGIEVPLVLGSASTDAVCGLGGLEGRAFRRGDTLAIGPEPEMPPKRAVAPDLLPFLGGRELFRVTEGPQIDWFRRDAVQAFYQGSYTVTADANRMGIRLSGPELPMAVSRQLITEGVSLGSIQVPHGGQPVILFVEQQTTGGYPKIANVVAADLPALGQLKPGDRIRFQLVDLREARELLYIQERRLTSPNSFL